ncbi:MAG TPA: hypothetical protein VLU43_13480 [Anaeromyxobacteraceae bacterium]|nr:hypothetical protein [Anaeromyxobacteraceae bacterium]
MAELARCPFCDAGVLERADGRLDQSGTTYLPTVVHSCSICGYARYEPALHAAWRADGAGPEAPPLRRAA